MSYGTTASLICPACGQAFLTMQHAMESMTQCPHCAHSAPRGHFSTQAQVAGVPQVRRRVAHAQPLSEMAPAPSAAPPVAWQQAAPVPAAAAPVPRMVLQHSQALMPMQAPPPPREFTDSSQRSTPPWRGAFLMLALVVACGFGLWSWLQSNAPASASMTSAHSAPGVATEVRRAQVVVPPPPPAAPVAMQDTQAFAADAKTLVTDFFAAGTPQERAACIHEAARHGAEIEAVFGPGASDKIQLRQLAHIPSVLLTLPGGKHVPLFRLVTSKCPTGALLRLEENTAGKRRIFWPLLVETHEGTLGTYLKKEDAEPAWFYVSMRPSHGLDLPAELRPKYLTFDVQTSAASEPHFIACVERETPLGRFMDRESDWGRVYLARLLVRKLSIQADSPCMIVMACEGAPER